MARRELLQLLADGDFHAAEDVAAALGSSESDVEQDLGWFHEIGLDVNFDTDKGCRLDGAIDLLDEGTIQGHLQNSVRPLLSQLIIADVIDSTNAELMRRLESDPKIRGLVCTAEQQSAGRGRRGRQWVSPYAGNIYLSLAWNFESGAAALEGLSLAVGVAVQRALSELEFKGIRLKWPNDLLCGDSKLGGILIEMVGSATGPCSAVVGIGINVNMPPSAATGIDQSWIDLRAMSSSALVRRNEVLAAMLNHLLPLLANYEELGFSDWREAWQKLNAHAGQAVIVSSGNRKMSGIARGIDHSGALQLETEAGIQSVHGGEVSLRAI
jgi:BirA family transcriptional regulator, biotin operon repressor / biotin---[acetyl-CoA-carboxylase] ligase